MPDVLIGQAYYLRFDPKLWRAQQPYAPLGALYAASHLRAEGHTVAFFDAMLARSEAEWIAALDRERPRLAIIYEDSFNYLSKMCLLRMRQAAHTMAAAARARDCAVIVSGSDATDHPETYLDAGATAVIVGEGDATVTELVGALKAGMPATSVAGVAARDSSGSLQRTASRPFVRALDELPHPAWDLVDVERYRAIWRRRHGYYAMNVATTRGCPYHCNWCAKPIYGQRYAVRGAADVVEEIAWLERDYRPDQLSIVDDVFGLQPGWVDTFARLRNAAGVRLPFRCLMRADQIDTGMVRALTAAGCRMVWMGAESGSQRILDAMEKGTRVEQIRQAARLLQGAGVQVGLFLQFGYPGEEWDDVEATRSLVREISPDDIGVSVSYPLPGTKFYERVRAQLGSKQNWFDSNDLAMLYRATYAPAFYRVLHRVVHHEFRGRQQKEGRRSVPQGRPVALGTDLHAAASWIYHRAALSFAERRLWMLARQPRPAALPVRLVPLLTRGAAARPSQQCEDSAS